MNQWNEISAVLNDRNCPLNELTNLFSKRINLLCIEDNPHICFLLCDEYFRSAMLNKKFVHTFDQAKQAILSKVHYHCWILDLTLKKPNDGLELLELKPQFPFCVVLSGAQSMDDASEARNCGAFWSSDKRRVMQNPNIFISRTCSLMALSFILKACRSKWHETFTLLLKEFISTPEHWSERCNRHQQTLRTICEEMTKLNVKQFLCFFHTLNGALTAGCLINPIDVNDYIHQSFIMRWDFYCHCAQYVLSHVSPVYAPLYLEK